MTSDGMTEGAGNQESIGGKESLPATYGIECNVAVLSDHAAFVRLLCVLAAKIAR